MELSEAYNTIDATLGMFRYFEEQVTDGMLKQDFLLTPLISCVEPVLDLENNTSELKRLEYYTYVECDTEYKVFIVDIRPVCSFMINEWPSHKAQRIYKLLRSVFFQCIDISRNIYKENEI